jgi:hypothetical protein
MWRAFSDRHDLDMHRRQRRLFAAALTNGVFWRFFVAHAGEKGRLWMHSSKLLDSNLDSGEIVSILVDIVRPLSLTAKV